jgi:hypothetical protein
VNCAPSLQTIQFLLQHMRRPSPPSCDLDQMHVWVRYVQSGKTPFPQSTFVYVPAVSPNPGVMRRPRPCAIHVTDEMPKVSDDLQNCHLIYNCTVLAETFDMNLS